MHARDLAARVKAADPRVRFAAVVVGLVVALNLLAIALDAAGGEGAREGPRFSSYVTDPDGLAAYTALLEEAGLTVDRSREELETAPLDPATTVVLVGGAPPSEEAFARLGNFLAAGGRLVVGVDHEVALGDLFERAPRWAASGAERAAPLVPVTELEAVGQVTGAGVGSWTDMAGTLPILGDSTVTTVVAASVGNGRALLLADPSPLTNRFLDESDNASFALGLAGARPVVFIESVHGYVAASGLAALPGRWRWMLGGLAMAALVWIAARARRLGPPEETHRELPPPRKQFVDALATLLVRTRQRDQAIAPLRAYARAEVARRAGLSGEADEERLRAAASQLGVAEDVAHHLFGAARTDEDVVAAGRALTSLVRPR